MMSSAVESVHDNRLNSISRFGFDLVFGLLPLFLLAPLLALEFQSLWQRSAMLYFPIPIFLCACFAVWNFQSPRSSNPNRVVAARVMFFVAVCLFGIAAWRFSPWLAHGCFVLFFAGWAVERIGALPWPRVIGWTGLMATSMRLPFELDSLLQAWTINRTTTILGTILDGLAVPYLVIADTFSMRGLEFSISKCCDGFYSVHALSAAIVLLLILTHRSLIVAIITVVTLPLWAIVQELLLLLSVVLLKHFSDRDASSGLDHTLLSLATFVLVIVCCWISMWFLSRLFLPVPAVDSQFEPEFLMMNSMLCWPQPDPFAHAETEVLTTAVSSSGSVSASRFMQRFSWLGAVGLIAFGVLSTHRWVYGESNVIRRVPRVNVKQLSSTPWKDSFPRVIGSWSNMGALQHLQQIDGVDRAKIDWSFSWQGQIVQLSVTLPLNTRPQLASSYEALGWQVRTEQIRQFEPSKPSMSRPSEHDTAASPSEKLTFTELSISNELGGRAYALVTYRPLNDNPESSNTQNEPASQTSLDYQVLLFCESGEVLTKQQLAELYSGFQLATDYLQKELEPRFRELIGTAQLGTAQLGTAQLGTAQLGTAQLGAAQGEPNSE